MNGAEILIFATMAAAIWAGNILSSHLGAETVPSGLRPLSDRWQLAARDPKWIRLIMWLLFAFAALFFLVPLVYTIYSVIIDLGSMQTLNL